MDRPAIIVRRIWATCLLLAGLNHARILLIHGLDWDYHGAPWPSAAYWSGLTLIDPLVAAALLWRPRIGVPATIILIATNVVHNLSMAAWRVPPDELIRYVVTSWQLVAQIWFLAFVLATWHLARRDLTGATSYRAR